MLLRLTPAVKALLISCFAAFLIQQTGDRFLGTHFLEWFGLIPIAFLDGHRYWQILTYSFLHADVMHLFFNLLVVAFIGGELEYAWGTVRFLRFYFFCATFSAAVYLLLQFFVTKGSGLYQPLIGSSGAVYGLLIAYGLVYGERVMLFMMLFPVKAKHFIWILALIELLTTVYSPGGGVAGAAHLAGMAGGFAYLWVRASRIVSKKRKRKSFFDYLQQKKKKRADHLKLIVNNDREFESDEGDSHNDPKTWH